jgi:TPR repeat protein
MPNDKKVPATVPTNSTLPQVQSDGLVARGLLAVRQSLAVPDKEDAESLFRKGMRFNGDKARTYLSAAAKLGHAEAQFELCILLGEYEEWSEAIRWLEKSVSQGFGPAQRYLAEFLSDPLIGEHLSNDNYSETDLYGQARTWYAQRANAGDAEAQYDFASWLNHPDSPIHNHVSAMRWMRAAAEQDHAFACMRLGEWLLEEKEPHRETEQGIHWL